MDYRIRIIIMDYRIRMRPNHPPPASLHVIVIMDYRIRIIIFVVGNHFMTKEQVYENIFDSKQEENHTNNHLFSHCSRGHSGCGL